MKLIIEDHCVRCGLCIDVAPSVFRMDKKKDQLLTRFDEIPTEFEGEARKGIEACAVAAIKEA